MMPDKSVVVEDLGRIDYKEAWDYQEAVFNQLIDYKLAVRKGEERQHPGHKLLLCEHTPVITLGKSGKIEHLVSHEEQLASMGVAFYKTNRGGDITFHGPGQLVVYPILDLELFFTDIHKYLRLLEASVMGVCADFGLTTGRSSGETGVWLGTEGNPGPPRKICAAGVRCSRWVTMHGIAFNVNTPLHYFDLIIPCGIRDKAVTSLQKELGGEQSMVDVKQQFLQHFSREFEAELIQSQVL